ncbi:uncharacterized protein F4822DRAFT_418488 [Hypoxylon trugodes]|uniref:uncharacterized protein n=1 Tax=Hypoxylon trugodes TaxID=326681 RepID=UPI00219C5BF7|nr:uncharacterized protein F4822DRAFT_418488 [Hypoxylon trugodes]KAI1384054.1 hypothetical protein F4822DRAFT_418488 [Hypoxylon trugodes]
MCQAHSNISLSGVQLYVSVVSFVRILQYIPCLARLFDYSLYVIVIIVIVYRKWGLFYGCSGRKRVRILHT